MVYVNQVEEFVKKLREGKLASFCLYGNNFYMELGERTLKSAKEEKQRYYKISRLTLIARGGDGIGGITI